MVALFVLKDSVYKKLGIDSYDVERNALTFSGNDVVICHPPCRAWGRLRHFAKPLPGEKELAFFAMQKVRTNGGILEHPEGSTLFSSDPALWCRYLPLPGQVDEFGGFTIMVNQNWFGFPLEKKTFFYICGIDEKDLPPIPISFDAIQYLVTKKTKQRKRNDPRKEVSAKKRMQTPIKMAEWLIKTASLIENKKCIKNEKFDKKEKTCNENLT